MIINANGFDSVAEFDVSEEFILWMQYRDHGNDEARAKLIDQYLPLAKIIAAKLYAKQINDEIAFEDYHQIARIGLIEAIERFDYQVGVKFRTFADHRIRGAILNGLELQTEKQQQLSMIKRLRHEQLESCKQLLNEESGAESSKDLFKHLAEISIALAIGWMLEDTGMAEQSDDAIHDNISIYKGIELQQLQYHLRSQIDKLNSQERQFIRYHYFQGFSMGEIAEIFKVSRGRISQINRTSLMKLGSYLRSENPSSSIL